MAVIGQHIRGVQRRRHRLHLGLPWRWVVSLCVWSVLAGCSGWPLKSKGPVHSLSNLTAALKFRPTSIDPNLSYRDACGQFQHVNLDPILAKVFAGEMARSFKDVQLLESGSQMHSADRLIQVDMSVNELILFVAGKRSSQYPATITLGTVVTSSDSSGMLLDRIQIQNQISGKVRTEKTDCRVDGVTALATQVVEKLARDLHDHLTASPTLASGIPTRRPHHSASGGTPSPVSVPPVPSAPGSTGKETATPPIQPGTTIGFRALLQDQNHNDILEGGETMTIEVEVTNTNAYPVQAIAVTVSGSSPLTRLVGDRIHIGTLKAGETKRAKIRGRVGAVSTVSQGEIILTLTIGTPGMQAPPGKRFVVTVGPSPSGESSMLDVWPSIT